MPKIILSVLVLTLVIEMALLKKASPDKKPDWAKKDIRDMDEADMERLLDQWEEDEEPLPPDELPEHLRPPPAQTNFPFDKVGSLTPDEIMKMTKKGKSLMMFINLEEGSTRDHCETLTSLWQSALRNNHIQAERYVIEDNRAIFMFSDGAQAWDAKEFLLDQDGLVTLTLEGQVHEGKRSQGKGKDSKPKPKKQDEL